MRVLGTTPSVSSSKFSPLQFFSIQCLIIGSLFAAQLEPNSKLGPRLKVTALIDPSADRANAALTVKRNSFVLSAYKDTVVYPNFQEYLKNLKPEKKPR